MDKKVKPADNPNDGHSSAPNVAGQDKTSLAPDLEGWRLTSSQRKFIESLQSDDSDSIF
ncbi:hypothetical protein BN439_1866 [Erwinia amylovora Ea644]|uniref:hypothetical protein n=1 Tax=Erwinia amylovora TaxID=552 RepID=UPI0002CC3682|nr:hypothetical protein [Erwinia amylovora]CCP02926.1 hypothetical protein BN439_1866 [Erwinia amylovora Ea644]